ncbi:MAG: methyltransferase domain-containing protein [Planctomycetota bacterium]|nr:MAG: methyltransferase domain-containing protein [Planctomycetota bacterium]REJ89604.1 MAG: methyltransferase domain-containing protein [Planctomycetota bacterium]REK24315.1 MAG: methyltransferase domain-containing protein [Planctomycetota bacterium]REK34630.1 MAG: methyltransferase domain-containing protein [Planctomycetota bacterium]
MSDGCSTAVSTAREYYNSEDADNFYFTIWGGQDIHIGLYESEDDPIAAASQRTVERMASRLPSIDSDSHVLDMGAGYGGAARYLAAKFGCRVTALNLSEVENERNRRLSREQGLDHLIDVVDGNFEDLPFEDDSFDIVWSQDAFLHSGARETVFAEAGRVLRPGGDLVFTDPMQADDCPDGVLQPILDRIHLETLASPAFYREMGERHGLTEVAFEDHTSQLVNHYSRVLAETALREDDLADQISQEYLERMKRGLQHWVNGGSRGDLAWGIFHFRR